MVARCPGVALVAVGAVSDDILGEVPKGYVVRRGDHAVTAEDIVERCRVHLARYKVPRQAAFVEDLPRTSTGEGPPPRLGKLDG